MNETSRPNHRGGSRRAHGLPGTLGLTGLSTLLPGGGLLVAGRRALGLCCSVPALVLGGGIGWYARSGVSAALDLAFDPARLTVVAWVAVGVLVVWVVNIVLTLRPGPSAGAAPVAHRGRLAVRAADVRGRRGPAGPGLALLGRAEGPGRARLRGQPRRHHARRRHRGGPLGRPRRVSVLLLGGDGSIHRPGVRTDSVVLASMDVRTGRTILFSLPRNLADVPFAPGSPLARLYPDGFTGAGDPAEWMLNAVYRNVPALHPGVLGQQRQRGRRRGEARRRGSPRRARRLLPAGEPGRLPQHRAGHRRRDRQHQPADPDRRQHRPRDPAGRLPPARAGPAARRVPGAVVRPRSLRLRRLPAHGAAALHDRRDHRRGQAAEPAAPLPVAGRGRAGRSSAPTSPATCCRRSWTSPARSSAAGSGPWCSAARASSRRASPTTTTCTPRCARRCGRTPTTARRRARARLPSPGATAAQRGARRRGRRPRQPRYRPGS